MKILKQNIWVILISLILFFIPFFWLKPGEMDLGGDGSRLYFYDPLSYLQSNILYNIQPSGIGADSISYFLIPFLFLLAAFSSIIKSPTLLISVFNGFQLSIAFFSCYLIVREFEGNEKGSKLPAVFAGLFYVLSPVAIGGWDRALLQHSQFFLNPLIFFLLLRFFLNHKFFYLFLILFLTFLFSFNFTYLAAPGFFSFYPLSIIFLILFVKFIRHSKLPLKKMFLGFSFFIFIQAFQLLPHILSLFFTNSTAFTNVFSSVGIIDRGLDYFMTIAPGIKLSKSFMILSQEVILRPELIGRSKIDFYSLIFIIYPAILLVGVFLNKQKKLLLIAFFFLIAIFFYTANITSLGFNFYKSLFYIPGFSMFRSFYGQWLNVYIFFYTLFLGLSLAVIFKKIKRQFLLVICFLSLLLVLIFKASPFLNGSLISQPLAESKGIKPIIKMDPEYVKALSYIRSLPSDSKILTFPLTDYGYQLLKGTDGGAYEGPSTIAYLLGKKDFSGYLTLPFAYDFVDLVSHKDYKSLQFLMSLLNIRYIFYNSDSYIYDENFPWYPYTYMKKNMPFNQKLYQQFIDQFEMESRIDFGKNYHLYTLSSKKYLPHIYISDKTSYLNKKDINVITLPFLLDKGDIRQNIQFIDKYDNIKDNIYFVAKKKNSGIEMFKARKETIKISSAVSPELYGILYPLLNLQRGIELNSYSAHMEYFESGIFSLQKQLNEIGENSLREDLLLKYEAALKNLVNEIINKKDSFYSSLGNQVNLFFILEEQKKYLYEMLENDKKLSDPEKNTIKSLIEEIFKSSFSYLNLNNSQIEMDYDLSIPQKGEYEVYLQSNYFQKGYDANLKLIVNGEATSLFQNSPDKNWLKYNTTLTKEKNDVKISLEIPNYPNLLQKEILNTNSGTNILMDQGVLLNYISALIQETFTWDPGLTYIVTFDYVSNLDRGWKKYTAVIEAGDDGKESLLRIFNSDEKAQDFGSGIAFKNVSIIRLNIPKVVFKKTTLRDNENNFPQITFTKINPTKYKINIENAKNPFNLIFLDSFNKNWKLYLSKKSPGKEKVTMNFFGGQVREGEHKLIFFDKNTFETWGKKNIAESNHFEVNGYANGWYIKPEDVGQREDYELILEMGNQQIFYKALAVSIVSLIIFLFFCIFLIIKYYYKKSYIQ